MEIAYFVTLNALAHLAFVGSRMSTSLFGLQLGASEATIGVLMALFAALPMLLSIWSGRLIDRIGPRKPLLLGLGALATACLLPFAVPRLETLYVSATLGGTAFLLVHIAMNSVFGAYGGPAQRAVNFAWLALAFSISGSLGPIVAGLAIDGLGYARAFAALAAFPVLACVLVLLRRAPLPRPDRKGRRPGSVLQLFRIPALRHTFIVSAVLAMGWDIYAFLIPIYGARLGHSASTIGTVMATFALATFVVRLAMPVLVRRLRPGQIILAALCVAGSAYVLFPLVSSIPLLMALSFVLGMGLGCAQPVIMSQLYEFSPPGRQGEAVGVRTLMLNGSHTAIPLASGALSAAAGLGPAFWLVAGALLSGAWFARRRFA
ncbi:MAG TPA: MFS transporter [Burkholderiales bacterium]|nr:MFS transporter [Burkholderiales bacterium]